ncbi:helix-turn-helix domain-containing protein [Algoriphagus formosus]|uniref:AraC family transcriptional regulator n=1 Tax=Algoriphagus formosus TaxID=2007308 RepID=A0A4R5V0Y1_9BACT|nr:MULTISPECIES: AraC family transcriptional regulator [Algoriphagus]TDK45420.1 AraC family transcriptional regulator [Algoriphagus aquimaris]
MVFFLWTGMVLGVLVGMILVLFPKARQNGNLTLGLSVLSVFHCLLVSDLYLSGRMVDFPHLSRTGNISAYLCAPLLYLFVKKTLYQLPVLKGFTWLIFLPPLVYFFDYLPYYLKSASEKAAIIEAQQLGEANFLFSESLLFPEQFHFYFRQLWLLGFIILIVRLLWINRDLLNIHKIKLNRYIYVFLWFFTLSLSIAIFPPFFRFLGGFDFYDLGTQAFTLAITLTGSALFLLFNPRLLYGFYWESSPVSIPQEVQVKSQIQTVEPVDIEGYREICKSLSELMKEEKLYLTQGFSINELSRISNVPVYKISPAINFCFDTNFNQWINQFRIEEFDRLIQQGEHERLTLDGIASKCGFSNRTTFISSFKKMKGDTPSQYLKTISPT